MTTNVPPHKLGFNSLFEMRLRLSVQPFHVRENVSILCLRCKAVGVLHEGHGGHAVSILCLRCDVCPRDVPPRRGEGGCFNSLFEMPSAAAKARSSRKACFNSLFEMRWEDHGGAPPSCVRPGFNSLFEMQVSWGHIALVSLNASFNSLFEMLRQARVAEVRHQAGFNSLFEMLGFLVF